jgi:hypothetical protein
MWYTVGIVMREGARDDRTTAQFALNMKDLDTKKRHTLALDRSGFSKPTTKPSGHDEPDIYFLP